uniref:Uncharacterized protein n=1 Tax=Anguilla anguilla TaxID=7936 RepID=A0A0E9Q485_ANGAN
MGWKEGRMDKHARGRRLRVRERGRDSFFFSCRCCSLVTEPIIII